jgi:IS4 transposase
LRENLTSSSYGEGLETGRDSTQIPRQSLTRQLFFKWIKQHLRIKRFLATSENAVKSQIWCAIATYVLIAIVKKTEISCALQPYLHRTDQQTFANQLNLFNI